MVFFYNFFRAPLLIRTETHTNLVILTSLNQSWTTTITWHTVSRKVAIWSDCKTIIECSAHSKLKGQMCEETGESGNQIFFLGGGVGLLNVYALCVKRPGNPTARPPASRCSSQGRSNPTGCGDRDESNDPKPRHSAEAAGGKQDKAQWTNYDGIYL